MRKTSYTLLFLIGMLNMLWAQLPVTLNTTVGSTNYTGTNSCGTGAAGTCFITFVVENASSNAIIIEEVGQWTSTANNGNSVDLYVTSTLLSGPVAGTFIPSSPPAGWTLAASGTIGGITTTQVNPVLTGLSILVPATLRIVLTWFHPEQFHTVVQVLVHVLQTHSPIREVMFS